MYVPVWLLTSQGTHGLKINPTCFKVDVVLFLENSCFEVPKGKKNKP